MITPALFAPLTLLAVTLRNRLAVHAARALTDSYGFYSVQVVEQPA